jgi:hypothetical protein
MHNAARRVPVAWGLLVAALVMAACGSVALTASPRVEPSPSVTRTPVLSLDFDDLGALEDATGLGGGYLPLDNAAPQPFTVRIASVAAGDLRAVPGRDGGYAARFPAHATGDKRRAILLVTSSSGSDPLGPGKANFSFGADFTLDAASEDGDLDNGNNLVQRGLSADPSQYKIQIDNGRASCRVAGHDGDVLVKSDQKIVPDTWYRVSCTRTRDAVELVVGRFGGAPERSVKRAATGKISTPRTTPFAVGGKATTAGDAVQGDSDQFNGAIDNVFLSIDMDS